MAETQIIFAAAKAGQRYWGNAAFMRRRVASSEAGVNFDFKKQAMGAQPQRLFDRSLSIFAHRKLFCGG